MCYATDTEHRAAPLTEIYFPMGFLRLFDGAKPWEERYVGCCEWVLLSVTRVVPTS